MGKTLENLTEKAEALLSLPYHIFREALSKLGILDEEVEKEYRARHEAAHSLLFMLAGEDLETAKIHFLRGSTCANINRLLGPTVQLYAGESSIGEKKEEDSEEKDPYKNTIKLIAGLAVTREDKYKQFFEGPLNEGLSNGVNDDWGDISSPCKYITARFKAIKGEDPSIEEIERIFYALMDKVHEVFQEEKFAKALDKIAELIKARKLKRNINVTIKRELEAIGLSEADLQEMSERIYSIDIDKIIRENESPRPPLV